MSVNINNEQPVSSTNATPAPSVQAPQMQTNQYSRPAVGGNINTQMRRSGRVEGSDARSAEALQVFTKVKDEAVQHQDLQPDFDIFRFDRESNQVGMSAILVVKTCRNKTNEDIAIVRTLILDNPPGTRCKPRIININNGYAQEPLEVPVTPKDVFTPKYWGKIAEFTRLKLNAPGLKVLNAGPRAIYNDFDFKDETLVRHLLIQSVNVCDDKVAAILGEAPFSIKTHVKAEDEQLVCSLDYSGTPVHDSCGNPIRSDLVITTSRKKNGQQQENEFYDNDNQLNQVSLYVNLEWTPPAHTGQMMFGNQMVPQATQPQFTPAIVVTDVRKAPWIQAFTLEMWWHALGNAIRCTTGQAWARTLLPSVGGSELRDIGALGYKTELNGLIDTKTNSFEDADFVSLMTRMVNLHPVFMIDIDPMGDNSSVEHYILDLLGSNKAAAVEANRKALNALFGVDFRNYYDFNQPMVTEYPTEIALGHYYDKVGEKADRRDLDVLGALYASKGNEQEWLAWYATQCGSDHPERRLANSAGFDSRYLGNVKYTGRARRLIINPALIKAMDEAAADAGQIVAMENLVSTFAQQRFTGNNSIAQFAIDTTARVNLGGTGNTTYNNQYSSMPGTFY